MVDISSEAKLANDRRRVADAHKKQVATDAESMKNSMKTALQAVCRKATIDVIYTPHHYDASTQ